MWYSNLINQSSFRRFNFFFYYRNSMFKILIFIIRIIYSLLTQVLYLLFRLFNKKWILCVKPWTRVDKMIVFYLLSRFNTEILAFCIFIYMYEKSLSPLWTHFQSRHYSHSQIKNVRFDPKNRQKMVLTSIGGMCNAPTWKSHFKPSFSTWKPRVANMSVLGGDVSGGLRIPFRKGPWPKYNLLQYSYYYSSL